MEASAKPGAPDKKTEEKKSGNKVVVILLLLLVLGLGGLSGYLFMELQNRDKIIVEKVNYIEVQSDTINTQKSQIDSMIVDINNLIRERDSLGLESTKLDSLKNSLLADLAEMEKNRNYWRGRYNREIKSKIDEANAQIALAKQETEDWKNRYVALQDTVVNLEHEKSDLMSEKDSLQQKVDIGSKLVVKTIKITTVNEKGKEYEKDAHKAKKIDKIKLSIDIAKNEIAEQNSKKLYIKLTDPSGAAIFNEGAGGGSFEDKNGNTEMYTMAKDFQYSGSDQNVTLYLSGITYKPGTYNLDIFIDGNKAGSTKLLTK